MSLRFLACEANLICTEDSPAGLAGLERALRMSCAQRQAPAAKTSVGNGLSSSRDSSSRWISASGGPKTQFAIVLRSETGVQAA